MKTKFILGISIISLIAFSCKKEENHAINNTQLTPEELEMQKADQKKLDSINQIVKANLTTIEFDKTEHDFGTITEGDKVETTFKIKNTGKKDLYITNAVASCGCTVPEVTKDAIKPGESTPILVKFNSTGKKGNTEKIITISCNTEKTMEEVKIKANILEKK